MLMLALKCLAIASFISCCGWVLFVRRDKFDDDLDRYDALEAELRKLNENNVHAGSQNIAIGHFTLDRNNSDK